MRHPWFVEDIPLHPYKPNLNRHTERSIRSEVIQKVLVLESGLFF